MAKSNAGSSNAVQTTFTKQKRELAKANELINQIRAQEKRLQRFTPDGKLQTDIQCAPDVRERICTTSGGADDENRHCRQTKTERMRMQ